MLLRLSVCAALLAAACGNNNESPASPDAPPQPDAPPPWAEALPGSMPTLVNLGGQVLTTPKVVPIFFQNDTDMQMQAETFLNMLPHSSYWSTTTTEYGVGDVTILPSIVSTDPAPTTDTALTTWLSTQLDGMHAGWTYDPQAIYTVFLPKGVVLTGSDGSKSCQDYGAYHDEVTGANNISIVYALIPRCAAAGPNDSELAEVTMSTSHELIEAATDPRVNTAPAFGDSDHDNYVWSIVPGAEAGDYCEYLDSAYQKLVGDFVVQRTYSNAAAKAGHDPCVPAPATTYIGAAPVFTETSPISGWNGTVTTKAVKVPLNMTKTIEVQLYSDQPTEPFTVSAVDLAAEFGGSPELTFQWDKQTGINGDKLHLMITRKANGQQFTGSEFAITASQGGQPVSMWWSYAAQ